MLDALAAHDQGEVAVEDEHEGYDGVHTSETRHDPFLSLAVAATPTDRIELGAAIALAFARNPMFMAVLANDLQLYSHGRFVLGAGSQIKPHHHALLDAWPASAERMPEYLLAAGRSGTAGPPARRYVSSASTTPTPRRPRSSSPGPNPHGEPPILLAGVGPRMTQGGRVLRARLHHRALPARGHGGVTASVRAQVRPAEGEGERGPREPGGPLSLLVVRIEELHLMITSMSTPRSPEAGPSWTPCRTPRRGR